MSSVLSLSQLYMDWSASCMAHSWLTPINSWRRGCCLPTLSQSSREQRSCCPPSRTFPTCFLCWCSSVPRESPSQGSSTICSYRGCLWSCAKYSLRTGNQPCLYQCIQWISWGLAAKAAPRLNFIPAAHLLKTPSKAGWLASPGQTICHGSCWASEQVWRMTSTSLLQSRFMVHPWSCLANLWALGSRLSPTFWNICCSLLPPTPPGSFLLKGTQAWNFFFKFFFQKPKPYGPKGL